MLTVNLEKELSKQPVSKVNAEELLYIEEYDRLGADVVNSEVLNRIGINKAVIQGKKLADENSTRLKEAKKYNLDKVYHISQIENLCKKYRLRFLPSAMFNGNIDLCLADKISTFEVTYNVQCISNLSKNSSRIDHWEERFNNTFIAAPASSFALQERPKDPLLFFKINEEYYYLIHKWGNDLSIFRRLCSLLERKITFWAMIILGIIISCKHIRYVGNDSYTGWGILGLALCIILSIFSGIVFEGGFRFISKNDITSRYLD